MNQFSGSADVMSFVHVDSKNVFLVLIDKEMMEFSYRIRFGIVDIFLRVYAHDECFEDKINRLTSHQASSLRVSSLIVSVGMLYC